jgi:hypothetical protein
LSVNPFQGVATIDALDAMSDKEILKQFVSKAYHLIREMDGRPFPLETICLTFEVPTLPSMVGFGYERVSVCPYIPNSMWWFQHQWSG